MSDTHLYICDRCGLVISDKIFTQYQVVQYDQENGDTEGRAVFLTCSTCNKVIADVMAPVVQA